MECGSLDPNGIGYVYKLKADKFEKIDHWQWIAKEEIIPEEIICIRVKDYIDNVIFSDQAKIIQNELYGFKT